MASHLPHQFLRIMGLIREEAREHPDERFLAPPEFMILSFLRQNEGATLSDLAEFMRVRKPTITEQVKRLEERGFLERVQDESDRRAVHLLLTSSGKKALQEAEVLFETYAGTVFAVLSPAEQQDLFSLLHKIIQHHER